MMRILNLVILTGIVNLSIVFADPSESEISPAEEAFIQYPLSAIY